MGGSHMGISKKLLIFFVSLTISTIVLVFSFTYFTTQSQIEKKFGFLLHEMVNSSTGHMNTKINEVERSMNMLAMNTVFTGYFLDLGKNGLDNDVMNLYNAKEIADITIYSSKDINSIVINLVGKEERVYHYGGTLSDPFYVEQEDRAKYAYFFLPWDKFKKQEPIATVLQRQSPFAWDGGIDDNFDDMYLVKRLADWDSGKLLGTMTMIMPIEMFTNLYANMEEQLDAVNILIDPSGQILAHSDLDLVGTYINEELKELIAGDNSQDYYTLDKQLIAFNKAKNGWYYISSIPMRTITKEIGDAWQLSFIIITFGVMIATLVFFIYTRRISYNMSILINKMLRVEKGDMIIEDMINTDDEVGQLDYYFNQMVGRLNDLIHKNYVQKLQKREAELSALQFQINPHFLYNTLESISAIGSVYGSEEISQISQKLGQMLRYSINSHSSEFVSLERELLHIENYFFIQEIRFEDRFSVHYDIDEDLRKAKVLKLILQPIVENIIQHGLADEDKGIIDIKAYKENSNFVIHISDNGKGMEQDKVEQVNTYINQVSDNIFSSYKKSVGIRNVNLRIKLAYGEEFGLVIKSEKGKGTEVLYKLPIL